MENKGEQTRSIEIDKTVVLSFVKSLTGALTCCQWRHRLVAGDGDKNWRTNR